MENNKRIEEYSNKLGQNNSTSEYIIEVIENVLTVLNGIYYETERIEDKQLQRYIYETAVGLYNNVNRLQTKDLKILLLMLLHREYKWFIEENFPFFESGSYVASLAVLSNSLCSSYIHPRR